MYRVLCLSLLGLVLTALAIDPDQPTVLFVVTGHTQLGTSEKETGYFLSEVTHPHHVLHEAGYRVDFVSPLGGAVQMDPKSRKLDDPINKAFLENDSWMHELANTKAPASINAADYGAIFFAGGHGAMWDFPDSQQLADIAADIYERGGIVAAVCHGPAGLVNITLADGTPLLSGKEVTGFTNAEEAAVKLTEQMPFLLEDKLRECGAEFVGADNFQQNLVVSGRLVTGQNPASAMAVGEAMARLLRQPPPELVTVASSDHQWTGIAISRQGRMFVNFPRWQDELPLSVAELEADGSLTPYPNQALNTWNGEQSTAGEVFVCVQSVYVDAANRLWILDPANPKFQGVVAGGPKLLEVDLSTDEVKRVIPFTSPVVHDSSYLNDVRVDTDRDIAYITDSGRGGIIVVDLKRNTSWRCLDQHPSTMAEDITLRIQGEDWTRDGKTPQVHSDGLALSLDGETLYYQPLTARWLHSIPTAALRDSALPEDQRGRQVSTAVNSGANDGLLIGPDGYIYLSSLEYSAVRRWRPGADHEVEWVRQHPSIAWPDSFAFGPDGDLYLTTSQIHKGKNPDQPYRILKLKLAD